MINHQIKIDLSFFDQIKKDYDKFFTDYINKSVKNTINLTNKKISKKWELSFINVGNTWETKTNLDGSISSSNGNIRLSQAMHGHDVVTIRLSSQSIAVRQFAISLSKKYVSLSSIKTRKNMRLQQSVKAKILKQRNAISIPTSFIATMKTGYTSVFRRDGKKIKEMRTITLPSMYAQENFLKILDISLNDTKFSQNIK